MLWSFKFNGNGHHGYHNKNRAVKGLTFRITENIQNKCYYVYRLVNADQL